MATQGYASAPPRIGKMPLTKKGGIIRSEMRKQYGKKKGDQVFYASENKGSIKGVHKRRKKTRSS